jgi:Spy/CpxP family protein refolding chaperone
MQANPLGLPFPGGFNPPAGLFDQWWKDSATSDELHLGEAQKKQLDDLALVQRLALIDAGAGGLKALTRLSALLNADLMDEPAYQQQLGDLTAATGRLVQTLGDMAITPRRVLTPEQWKKLLALRAARKAAVASGPTGPRSK